MKNMPVILMNMILIAMIYVSIKYMYRICYQDNYKPAKETKHTRETIKKALNGEKGEIELHIKDDMKKEIEKW